ncbi:hypothetical protein BUALT_Bualt19G0034200 [Buddleja alternifolia]|uniref:Reverse transcriptase domain-containing protein n=1 Tax=Buddleja alternifolia TaxID=168488 RepID=A0AAV6W997_9LAMI|nr:hypothetical protein BUALT_Bualt19G0034200 [Buddleja alternifolia]
MVHTLKRTKHRHRGMIIKIDLEKACDRVDWSFLRQTLSFFNIPESVLRLIMFCVTSINSKVLWNGEALPVFSTTCGLRQGDPLSPYLFMLCMECLAYLINEAVSSKKWDPLEVCRREPKFSHLFFADDLILMAKATNENATSIKGILMKFYRSSGLVTNLGKSRVYFSRSLNWNLQRRIASTLGLARTLDLGKYLGVPIHHGRVSPSLYRPLIEKIQSCLSTWKAKFLNMAARATLIQSVISTMPFHVMHTVLFSPGTCNSLDKINRTFLWAGDGNTRKLHTVGWSKIIQGKEVGGLDAAVGELSLGLVALSFGLVGEILFVLLLLPQVL